MMDRQSEFVVILEANIGILIKIAGAYSKTSHDREDLINDMVYQLWKSYPTFEHRSRISTWIYRVALNTALSKRNQDNKQRIVFSDSFPKRHHEKLVTEDPDTTSMYTALYESIEHLGRIDRAIILLYLDGLTHEDIGQITGISTSNVGTRIGRIKTQLKRIATKKQD